MPATRTASAVARAAWRRVSPRLGAVRDLAAGVIDLCYPGRCAACDVDCAPRSPLCPSCDEELRRLESEPACPCCAMPLVELDDPCPHCTGDGVPHYDRVLRLATYHDPVRRLVHHMKYHQRWTLGEFLADRLFDQERVKGLLGDHLGEGQCLVPVPLHRLRQVARGYNQADVVARRLAKKGRMSVAYPVVRLRHTETQTHLHSRARRAENLKDAFCLVDDRPVRGKHVVVVDDVVTTGATLQALARTLRPAKPASLCAIVIAIADPRGRDFEAI